MIRTSSLVLLVAALTSGAFLAVAQSGGGSLRGRLTDPSGRTIPDATVVATNSRGKQRSAKSDVQGQYQLQNLAPGTYRIRVSAVGFAPVERADFELMAGTNQTVDFPLALAAVSESVTVQAATPIDVDPANNAGAVVIRGKELEALADDRDDLAADLAALAGPAAGPNGGQIYIDGFTGGRLPAKSSIREVRINQNPFSAEYDRIGTGRIEILTNPGSQEFHGEIQTHDGSSVFNSRNPFTPVKPPWNRLGVEGEVTGPIGKNTSFLADFEVRKWTENSFVNARVLDENFAVVPVSQGVLTPRRDTENSVRVDRQLSPNHTLTGRYIMMRDAIDNQGASGFSLPSRIYNNRDANDTVQMSETGVYGLHVVNETRARYSRQRSRQEGTANLPTTVVLDAFTGGGSPLALSFTNQDRMELINTTTLTHGKHLLRWGGRLRGVYLKDQDTQNYTGTFTFASLDSYRITQMGLQSNLASKAIREMGGGASQFSIAGGNPLANLNQYDAGIFMLDEWRLKPSLTLSLGLRYEMQTRISDRSNIAPRVGIAWGVGAGGKAPKAVIRVGAGIFYDRVSEVLWLNAIRRDGIHQLQFVVPNPDFYPAIPTIAQLQSSQAPQAIRQLDEQIRAPQLLQISAGVERQLTKNLVAAVSYIHSKGWHSLRSRSIVAPAIQAAAASSATYLYEASGRMRQNQLLTNLNARISAKLSFSALYALGKANSDTDGAGMFPAQQYNLQSEYGRADYDVRHRVQVTGNVVAPWGIRLSPFVVATSGRPFNITVGRDLNGDTLFTDRPALATDISRASVRQTAFGVFDLAPIAGQTPIPRNYGNGPAQVALNLRIAKSFKFGEEVKGRPGPFEFTIAALSRNLLNHPNLALPVGNLSSTLFGQPVALVSGGGGNSAGGNRRIEFMLKLSF